MAAPFRIEKRVRGEKDAFNDAFKSYLDRLLRMIPGEVVGLYMIGSGFIPQGQTLGSIIWAVICLGLVILVRIYGTADTSMGKPPQPVPVFIAAGAFVIWLYWLGGPFVKLNLHVPWIGSLAVLLWSFVIPIFYQG